MDTMTFQSFWIKNLQNLQNISKEEHEEHNFSSLNVLCVDERLQAENTIAEKKDCSVYGYLKFFDSSSILKQRSTVTAGKHPSEEQWMQSED